MIQYDLGLIGLAVMGQNLVLNMERNGYKVAVYNRTASKTQDFMAGPAAGKNIGAAYTVEELVASLEKPRIVMAMVQAGAPVDAVIAQVKPLLEAGDLLIDGGNSFFQDSERRSQALAADGIHFMGVGISGGEEGALWGPSIMPGGSPQAYAMIEPIFEAIAARVNGEPCVTHIGPRGAGHYVKMVHNGIEYGDMQLIAEAYDLLHRGLGLTADELHQVFSEWNTGPLASFLIEITAEVFTQTDEESGQPLVEMILDVARQKGTGKWTSQEAFDLGVPIPTINAAVEARNLSAFKAERGAASGVLKQPARHYTGERKSFIRAVGDALYASKICSYAQGMWLLSVASRTYGYDLELSEIARIWRGGCIIRARLLDDVRSVFALHPRMLNLMLAPSFRDALLDRQSAWRSVLQTAIDLGIPTPAMCASLTAFDGYRSARLPANLIQAQRDFFGAHTYERIDRRGTFHTEWVQQKSREGK